MYEVKLVMKWSMSLYVISVEKNKRKCDLQFAIIIYIIINYYIIKADFIINWYEN